MGFKSIIHFEKRSLDWWILTVLPIFFILVVMTIEYLNKGLFSALSAGIQQILTFSVVLSSTDFALRPMIRKEDCPSRLIPIIPLFCAFITYIIYIMSIDTLIIKYPKTIVYAVFSIITVALGIFSIILYNNNSFTNLFETDPVEQKLEQDQEDIKLFENGD